MILVMYETVTVKAPYFESLNIPPENPYAEYLESEGLAGELLIPYLHRLALLKENYPGRSDNRDPGEDGLNCGALDRLVDTDGFCTNKDVSKLTVFYYDVLDELRTHPDLYESGDINWSQVGNYILDRASTIARTAENDYLRRDLLASSAIALLFAENPEDRLDFVSNVYSLGLENDMHDALDNSPVTIIGSGYNRLELTSFAYSTIKARRSIRRIRVEADIFGYDVSYVDKIKELVRRRGSTNGDVHDTMRTISSQYADGLDVSAELQWQAQMQTVDASTIDRYRIDPTKAERYALEEVFMRDQMAEIFPNGDTTVFREALAARWEFKGPHDYNRLSEDARSTILELSRPVVDRYEGPGDEVDFCDYTDEQRAAFRFVQLKDDAKKYERILEFVDRSIFGSIAGFMTNIYDIPANGADLPDRSLTLIRFANNEAKRLFENTGERIGQEELRDAILLRRNQLMKLAAIHIDSFGMTRTNGGLSPQHLYEPTEVFPDAPIRLFRKDDRTLDFRVPIFKVTKAELPSSARLACVALRVNLQRDGSELGKPEQEPKNVNVIDALSEVVIEEAYARGLIGNWVETTD